MLELRYALETEGSHHVLQHGAGCTARQQATRREHSLGPGRGPYLMTAGMRMVTGWVLSPKTFSSTPLAEARR